MSLHLIKKDFLQISQLTVISLLLCHIFIMEKNWVPVSLTVKVSKRGLFFNVYEELFYTNKYMTKFGRSGKVKSCMPSSLHTRRVISVGQSGTRCLMTVLIVLNGSWKQFSLAATSVSSALEVISMMRYINLRFTYFYLLT